MFLQAFKGVEHATYKLGLRCVTLLFSKLPIFSATFVSSIEVPKTWYFTTTHLPLCTHRAQQKALEKISDLDAELTTDHNTTTRTIPSHGNSIYIYIYIYIIYIYIL